MPPPRSSPYSLKTSWLSSKPNLYLDVDGVLLGKEDLNSPEVCLARNTEDFLTICLERFKVYWLTTHCKEGSASRVLKVLSPHAAHSAMKLLEKIHPTKWNTFKTEAIDLSSNFYWIDDQPLNQELEILKKHKALHRWIEINTRRSPDDLKKAINFINALPMPRRSFKGIRP